MKYEYFASFDVDSRFAETARNLPDYNFQTSNFLELPLKEDFNAVIMNPPYIRHELISKNEKEDIYRFSAENNLPKLHGRSNYFCYFILKAIYHLKENGIIVALVYDSLESTQYGRNLNNVLLSEGKFLERIKLEVPFENRLIDAEIIVWRKGIPSLEMQTEELDFLQQKGFVEVSKVADVKRGTSFLKREYFIDENGVDERLVPILTKHKNRESFIASTNVFAYLASNNKAEDLRILAELYEKYCDVRLENLGGLPALTTAPILFNYYFRNSTKHLFNPKSVPVSDNFYCITPKKEINNYVHWLISNSDLFEYELLLKARNQGSGLNKLQIYEYKRLLIPDYTKFNPKYFSDLNECALKLIKENAPHEVIRKSANLLLQDWSGNIV